MKLQSLLTMKVKFYNKSTFLLSAVSGGNFTHLTMFTKLSNMYREKILIRSWNKLAYFLQRIVNFMQPVSSSSSST